MDNVLEIGCGNGFGTQIVLQQVKKLTAIDLDKKLGEITKKFNNFKFRIHNIVEKPTKQKFDGAYALDVLEHIPKKYEGIFISNISSSLKEEGMLIIGVPSLQSRKYTSPDNKSVHINCKEHNGLRKFLKRHFHNVLIFSMNDEVVHTGFYPLAHYLFAICCCKKNKKKV